MDRPVSTSFDRREVFPKLRQHDRMDHGSVSAWLAGFLAGRRRADLRLLDLGCNDARDMARLLAVGDVAASTGVDPDEVCLADARKNLAGSPADVELLAADGQAVLSEKRQAVDVIWMGLLLHHFPKEKARLFAMAKDALRPGGVLLPPDPMPGPGENAEAFLARFNREIETNWSELTPDVRRVLVDHWSRHAPVDAVEGLARAAGFATVRRYSVDAAGFYALLYFAV